MTNERILDKVKKLLALAANEAASEGERENALRMAHNLLAAHNLAMSDLHNHEKQEPRDKIHLETFHMVWCRLVANETANLFFCKYVQGDKINATKGCHYFIGKESNVVTASYMTEYLISSILKQCRKLYKHNLAPESRSFAIGAANALILRMRKMREQESAPSMGTGIVLYDVYKSEAEHNAAYMKTIGFNVVTQKVKSSMVQSGTYDLGKAYGQIISINEQVSGSPKQKAITG